MKETAYRNFSLKAHTNLSVCGRPGVCQFELTYACGLHCTHCYTDCYNRSSRIKSELRTKDVKRALDGIRELGVVWLCLTGGDPVARPDFGEIYRYCKEKGFIVTVFTSGYFCDRKIVDLFKESPPFSIEITLNAVTRSLYEKITHVRGSFGRVMKNFHSMRRAGFALTIKSQVTRENVAALPQIKKFAARYKVRFLPDASLYPRLDGNQSPCSLRISPREVLRVYGFDIPREGRCLRNEERYKSSRNDLFPCAVRGGSGFSVDPYARMFLCPLLRIFNRDILAADVKEEYAKLLTDLRALKFVSRSACRSCDYFSEICLWCPGRAYMESGDWEQPVAYLCELAHLEAAHV
jgi:MoaA/NifB/PqqE/SkfB family radical SAM enzyme